MKRDKNQPNKILWKREIKEKRESERARDKEREKDKDRKRQKADRGINFNYLNKIKSWNLWYWIAAINYSVGIEVRSFLAGHTILDISFMLLWPREPREKHRIFNYVCVLHLGFILSKLIIDCLHRHTVLCIIKWIVLGYTYCTKKSHCNIIRN